ncbi:AMP-binding protein, partial [Mycobacterium sp. 1274761.0]|uniref:AMP-binding protein n=1 Tax=Mycobacterium sp. 1274761.0 TaxID=1834077 RepID=UPI0012E807A4
MNPAEHAGSAPDSPAVIVTEGRTITYGELFERSQRVAAVLHESGLRRGDGVALILP